MTFDPPNYDPSPEDRVTRLVRDAIAEAEALLRVLPAVLDARWERAPRSQGQANETGRRSKGPHSDPTTDVALDPARLHLSTVVTRGERHLADAVSRIRGVRRGVERALDHWQGDDSQ